MTSLVCSIGPAAAETCKHSQVLTVLCQGSAASLTTARLAYPYEKCKGSDKADRPDDGTRQHNRHFVLVIATMVGRVCRSVSCIVLAVLCLLRARGYIRSLQSLIVGHNDATAGAAKSPVYRSHNI